MKPFYHVSKEPHHYRDLPILVEAKIQIYVIVTLIFPFDHRTAPDADQQSLTFSNFLMSIESQRRHALYDRQSNGKCIDAILQLEEEVRPP